MAKRGGKSKSERSSSDRPKRNRPKEVPMTDLGWTPEDADRAIEKAEEQDIHAAGTPGGGTASGGLAGTNKGSGAPDDVDLESALGSGLDDTSGDEQGSPAYSGPSGGAVGGTPAGKRAGARPATDQLSHRPEDSDPTNTA